MNFVAAVHKHTNTVLQKETKQELAILEWIAGAPERGAPTLTETVTLPLVPGTPVPPGATGGGSNNTAAARAAVRFFCWSSDMESSPLGDPPGHEVASWEMSTGYSIKVSLQKGKSP